MGLTMAFMILALVICLCGAIPVRIPIERIARCSDGTCRLNLKLVGRYFVSNAAPIEQVERLVVERFPAGSTLDLTPLHRLRILIFNEIPAGGCRVVRVEQCVDLLQASPSVTQTCCAHDDASSSLATSSTPVRPSSPVWSAATPSSPTSTAATPRSPTSTAATPSSTSTAATPSSTSTAATPSSTSTAATPRSLAASSTSSATVTPSYPTSTAASTPVVSSSVSATIPVTTMSADVYSSSTFLSTTVSLSISTVAALVVIVALLICHSRKVIRLSHLGGFGMYATFKDSPLRRTTSDSVLSTPMSRGVSPALTSPSSLPNVSSLVPAPRYMTRHQARRQLELEA